MTMRKLARILSVAGLLLSLAAVARADAPPNKDKKTDDSKDRAKQLAQDIFDKVDKHKHGFVTKIEFKKADAELTSAIKQMASDGVIGKGRPSDDAKSKIDAYAGGFADADTDHDKKVTLAEFTDYVSRAIEAADQEIRLEAAAQTPHGGYGGHGRR